MSETVKKVAVGIDLGGTAMKIGIVNKSYEILAQTSIPTNAERPYEEVIADMGETALALFAQNGDRKSVV